MSPLEPVSDLTEHLGYWLRFVSNHVSCAFARKLAAKDVTVAEWVMLRTLYGNAPVSPSRVAEAMGMTKGAITKLSDRLVLKKWIVRNANPEDARAQTLALTPRGRRIVPVLATFADENDADFFGHLSDTDRDRLARILRKLVDRHAMKRVPIQ